VVVRNVRRGGLRTGNLGRGEATAAQGRDPTVSLAVTILRLALSPDTTHQVRFASVAKVGAHLPRHPARLSPHPSCYPVRLSGEPRPGDVADIPISRIGLDAGNRPVCPSHCGWRSLSLTTHPLPSAAFGWSANEGQTGTEVALGSRERVRANGVRRGERREAVRRGPLVGLMRI
jgi:hypothetical protein